MYDGAKGNVHREDYLLGKKVDKNFEKYSDVVNAQKAEAIDSIVGTRAVFNSGQVTGLKTSSLQKDIIKSEDPFVAVKVREETKRRELMDNPLMKMKLMNTLKDMMTSKKEKKKSKKSKKKKKRARSSSSSDSDSSDEKSKDNRRRSTSPKRKRRYSDRSDEPKRVKRRESSGDHRKEDKMRKRSRSRSPEQRNSSQQHSRKPRRDSSRSLEKSRDKPRSPKRHRSRSRSKERERESMSPKQQSSSKTTSHHRHREENRKTRPVSRSRSRSRSADKSSSSRKQYDSHIPRHLQNQQRSDSESDDERRSNRRNDDEKEDRKKSYGLVEMRKRTSEKSEEAKAPSKEYKLIRIPTGRGNGNANKQREPRRMLSAEEKAARLAEMQDNVKWRDEVRDSNIAKGRVEDKEEKEEADKTGYAPSFIRTQMRVACDDMTMEKRLQSNKKGVQRSHGYMDRSFARK
uniref:Pre-mRNA-splicing factor CWC25 homolog n=1 Tax=Caenorhabditis tropicalis TaxID=1561998 RepID=A0A1I7TML4_9PELO